MINNDDKSLITQFKHALVGSEIEEKMLARREIFLWGEINDESAESIVKKMLYFDGQGDEDITVYLNSPGGAISSGLAIYDAMQYAKSDIGVVCMGLAASMGAVILAAGTKGKRKVWGNARVMIHQPLIAGNFFGPGSDIQIQAEEMLKVRERLNTILATHTGQPIKKIDADTDRDFFMSADEALNYGIVDVIVKY
ncbi:MAG: ATP-dependent Clp protease proteolytic subunit [Chitinivibrionales bacterium]|nr:ATP-dependent Clp protease proteolytic subunit [Chitinivibrionales bacterium]